MREWLSEDINTDARQVCPVAGPDPADTSNGNLAGQGLRPAMLTSDWHWAAKARCAESSALSLSSRSRLPPVAGGGSEGALAACIRPAHASAIPHPPSQHNSAYARISC